MTAIQPVNFISRTQKLLDGLERIVATDLDLPLVPIGNHKQPLGDRWQQRPFTATQLIEAINSGGVSVTIKNRTKKIQPLGFGLITGRKITVGGFTHYLMALDQDGASACRRIDVLSGGQPLPKTVAFTSDRPGRCQYLFLIPEQYADAIKTKKIKTGVIGDDGKAEQLEFRWQNLQSVLPPSVHPTTGEYRWVDGCAIDETKIAIAPDWIIEQMLIDSVGQNVGKKREATVNFTPRPQYVRWNDTDFALSYLNALDPYRASDYDEWLNVGMALHSVDDSLLTEWDKWSAQSTKYKPGDCERKWRSFSTGGGVTLGTLAHMAKLDGWARPFTQKTKTNSCSSKRSNYNSPKKSTVTGDKITSGDTSKLELLGITATVTAVTELLKTGLADYLERAELDSIEARSLMSKASFWQMVAAIRTSFDEVLPEDTEQLNRLIDWNNATLDFKKVLPQPLADAFYRDAAILNIDPVSLWQYFLPAVLSLAGKRVGLDVESHLIPAIAWTCIVGESGTGKSRAESVILGNLKQRQYRERKRYQEQMLEYKQINQSKSKNDDLELEPPDPERKYLFEVATIQAVMRRLSEQHENGSIWARDEIAGLFKSLGQFQGKKGDNEGLECLLKMWDGSGSFVDRVNAETDSYAVPETRLNISGGIQPGAFRTAFKDPHDAQGLQARFLYAIPQVFPAKRVKGYCQLNELLPPMYDWLEHCPVGTVRLSPEADRRYTNLVEQIGSKAEAHSCPAVRAWMRKLPAQLLRIALGLHLIECYYDCNKYAGELQRDTLERAVEICRYYRSAFALVQEKTADSDNASSILLKIWDMATINPNGVTPREIYRSIKAIGRRAKEVGRSVGAYTIELLSKLVQMGKGKLNKNGRSYRFFAEFTSPDNPNDSNKSVKKDGNMQPEYNNNWEHQKVEVESVKISTPTQEKSTSETADFIQEKTEEVEKPVTEGTNARSHIETQLETSPEVELSPVTVEHQPDTSSDDISWSVQFLADLENTSTPHQRFDSIEQLIALFHELEKRTESCYQELISICPEFFERLGMALSRVSECLPE